MFELRFCRFYCSFNAQCTLYITQNKKPKKMKKKLLLCLVIPLILGSCTQESASPMEGAWKLAFEYEFTDGNRTILYPGANPGSEIKLWSGDRWALVGAFLEDSLISDVFAGGKFTLEGTDYREIVEFHSAPEYLGQTVKLWLEIRDDTLTQIWPVDENGEPIQSQYYMEKWVKFE